MKMITHIPIVLELYIFTLYRPNATSPVILAPQGAQPGINCNNLQRKEFFDNPMLFSKCQESVWVFQRCQKVGTTIIFFLYP